MGQQLQAGKPIIIGAYLIAREYLGSIQFSPHGGEYLVFNVIECASIGRGLIHFALFSAALL